MYVICSASFDWWKLDKKSRVISLGPYFNISAIMRTWNAILAELEIGMIWNWGQRVTMITTLSKWFMLLGIFKMILCARVSLLDNCYVISCTKLKGNFSKTIITSPIIYEIECWPVEKRQIQNISVEETYICWEVVWE